MIIVQNETQEHSAALKNAGQSPIGLLPLDGDGSAAPSLQLHSVFDAVSSRVPSGDAMSRFVGLEDKSWDHFKNSFSNSLEVW